MSRKASGTVLTAGAKPALVPRLRFPEFRKAGDWTTAKLGSLASISTEKVAGVDCVPMSITSGVGLVSQEEKFGRVIAGDSYKNYLLLKPNDFAYNKSATKEYPEGFLTLYSGKQLAAVPNSIFTCFRINGESPVPTYLNYLFFGNLHGQWLRKFIQVGARAHGSLSINDHDLMALPVPLPTGDLAVSEQQKIAECLRSLDDLIAAQARKVDALRAQMDGLMQRLFPREGETIPRLRFPGFGAAEEWAGKELADLVDISSGSTPSKANPNFWNGSFPWVSAKDMKRLFLDRAEDHISAGAVSSGAKVVPPGTLLLLTRGMTLLKDVPICVLLCEMSFNQDVKALRPKAGVNSAFLALMLVGNKQRILQMVDIAGHGTGKLDTDELKAFRLLLPHPKEQQRIAELLMSVEALINSATGELDILKAHKKGLMQQLFPSAEALDA